MSSSADSETWRLVTIRTAIAVYWLTMFLGTHLPLQDVMQQLPASDKHLHFTAYALLGAALPWWSTTRPTAGWRRAAWLYALVLVYAAVDEWLQPPVGRAAEFADWLADAAGALTGITLGTWLRRRTSHSGNPQEPTVP